MLKLEIKELFPNFEFKILIINPSKIYEILIECEYEICGLHKK